SSAAVTYFRSSKPRGSSSGPFLLPSTDSCCRLIKAVIKSAETGSALSGVPLRHWLAVAVLILAGTATAQVVARGVSVSGTVLDPSGASTPDGTVELLRGAGQTPIASTRTDLPRKCVYPSVPEGSYSLQVQHEGFKSSTTSIRVSNKPPAPVKIVLSLAEVESEISVNGSETAAEVSTSTSENADAAAVDQNLLQAVPV